MISALLAAVPLLLAAAPAPRTAAKDAGTAVRATPDAGVGDATLESLQASPGIIALKKRLAATQSLTAKFTQKRHWAALKDTLVTEGTLQSDRNGKLVWRTEKPSASELTLDGTTATMRFPAVNTTQTFDLSAEPGMAKVFESITAVLKADLERLVPLYSIRIVKESPLRLELAPRNEAVANVVSKLRLDFNGSSDLVGVVLDEPGGDSTEIAFKDHVLKTDSK